MEISDRRYAKIKHYAQSFLTCFEPKNPLELLDKLDVHCKFINLSEDLGGFTDRIKLADNENIYYVYINSRYKYDDTAKNIIVAHELGHILLHSADYLNLFDTESSSMVEEYEADLFSMELMPSIRPVGCNYRQFSPTALRNYLFDYTRKKE